MASGDIIIKGARVNNLKNVDVAIPRGKFVVVTGLSGSGKSSLAFDTLYAEGQRRYVESLSSYARQFMGRMTKPDCDFIRGLPPAIAVEQRTVTRNSRSTVGTSTEIYDYLRLLFARVGKTYSPISGQVVKKHTADDVIECINAYPDGTRLALLTDIIVPEGRDVRTQLDILIKGGYSRLMDREGRFIDIAQVMATDGEVEPSDYRLLIDRMAVTHQRDDEMRLLDSLQTAFYEGKDECIVVMWKEDGTLAEHRFSKRFELDGMTFEEPTDLMFNFNNPLGACPTCEGFGNVIGIDESLVVPDRSRSVYDDAVMCWRGQVMGEWKREFIHVAAQHDFPIHKPYNDLNQEQLDLLWHGTGDNYWKGIDGFFEWVKSKAYAIQFRVLLARYRGRTVCPTCHGTRLKPQAEYVKVGGMTISDLVRMPVKDLLQWFRDLQLDELRRGLGLQAGPFGFIMLSRGIAKEYADDGAEDGAIDIRIQRFAGPGKARRGPHTVFGDQKRQYKRGKQGERPALRPVFHIMHDILHAEYHCKSGDSHHPDVVQYGPVPDIQYKLRHIDQDWQQHDGVEVALRAFMPHGD